MIYNKERPYNFDMVVGQKFIVDQLRHQSIHDIWLGQYIFAGKFGSGKTTMARIIRMAANCQHKDANGNPCMECEDCQAVLSGTPDILEIDAASNTGVDSIRELKEYASCRPLVLKKKVVIIDEVHKLSSAAFDALLKLLEEPPEYMIFILCTTALDAIPATVQSRCAIYRFGAIDEADIEQHVLHVAHKQGISITEDAAGVIARHSEGAMRNALKYLEQLGGAKKEVDAELCRSILGLSDARKVFSFLSCLMNGKHAELIELVDQTSREGKDFLTLAKDLSNACADCIVVKCAEDAKLRGEKLYLDACRQTASQYELEKFCQLSELCIELVKEMKQEATKPQFLAHSFSLIQRLHTSQTALLERMERMEKELEMLKSCSFLPEDEGSFAHAPAIHGSPVTEDVMREPESKEETADAVEESPVESYENLGFEDAEHSVFEEDAGSAEVMDMPAAAEEESEDLDDDPFTDFFNSHSWTRWTSKERSGSVKKDKTQQPKEAPKESEKKVPDLMPVPDEMALPDRARQARECFITAVRKETEMEELVRKCEAAYTEQGVVVMATSQAELNKLLMFLGRNGLKDISVRLKSA